MGRKRDSGLSDAPPNSTRAKPASPRSSDPQVDHDTSEASTLKPRTCPAMNVVIQVVGSRGDVQPFIALGTALQSYGHRVRLATHDTFADFVRESGLEFFPIGGDPEHLMAYMVKNPGLMPSLSSLGDGDLTRKRRMVRDILLGCWRSCIERDGISGRPFVADAIIANPPGFAYVHCGEALGIPVHVMFTMPWTPTKAFPHPFTNSGDGKPMPVNSKNNYWTYSMIEYLTWQGLGDVINRWRRRVLGLETLSDSAGCELLESVHLPYTYCWSPALVPQPDDWGQHIDICGFFMRSEPSYTPPDSLASFLDAGPPPVYVGFGSIVIDNAAEMTQNILEAGRLAGVRLIVSRGWSKLGGDNPNTGDVYYLDDCPHEWLFKQVAAVVHHGGAGTTACGLFNARPTVVVPFFGDQPFWGSVVAARGAGPDPIPHKALDSNNLAAAIEFCLAPQARESAQAIATQMRLERGVDRAVESFHRHLPVDALSCDLIPGLVARWQYRLDERHSKTRRKFQLSDTALAVLLANGSLQRTDVEVLRSKEYQIKAQRWDPFTAGLSSLTDTASDLLVSLAEMVVEPGREFKHHHNLVGKRVAAWRSAAAVGRGVRGAAGAIMKGTLVDLPVAITEGFRNAPKLVGDIVHDPQKVTGWKSGGTIAYNNLRSEIYHGVTGVAVKPIEGAKSGGTVGLLKGIFKGSLGLVVKPGSAIFGLIAYPSQGVYRSIKKSERRHVDTIIDDGRAAELDSVAEDMDYNGAQAVIAEFQRLLTEEV
ncbi:hypothetical protein ACJZ2D_008702 [Fusarium nematophilum]